MKEKFNNLFKKQEQLRIKIIADLKPHSVELINTKPSPAVWSVADNIAHLIAAEEYVFNYVNKKIKDGSPLSKTGFRAKRKRMILKIAFALPLLKFKVPKSVAPLIKYSTLKDLEAKWENTSNALYELINSLDESYFHKDIWHHPRVGKINLVQMIDFANDHTIRHEGQIKRTLKALGK